MFKKDFRDYILLGGGIFINFLLAIIFIFGVSLGLNYSLRWILVVVSGTIVSLLMIKEWHRTFIIHKIIKENDPTENFRKCHRVIKAYKHKIIENNFREYYLKVRVKFMTIPMYVTLFCEQNHIFLHVEPGFNFGPFLLIYPRIEQGLKEKLQKT